MVAIDQVAPIKERRIKHNSQEWFDGEISEAIKNLDKSSKKIKKLDYISVRNYIMRLEITYISWFSIRYIFFENKLNEWTGKPTEL